MLYCLINFSMEQLNVVCTYDLALAITAWPLHVLTNGKKQQPSILVSMDIDLAAGFCSATVMFFLMNSSYKDFL